VYLEALKVESEHVLNKKMGERSIRYVTL